MDHDHAHADSGSHQHGPSSLGRAFAVGIALNSGFILTESVYGVLSHSMALVADAAHNLSDVLGLALSWGAASLARRKPSSRRTYGFRSTTIVAALANALALLFVTGGIAWESLRRLFAPQAVVESTVIAVALIGVAINGASAALFAAGGKRDLNIRSAFLHFAADAGVSLGVAGSGAIILLTGWRWFDPAVSILLSLVILASTWSLLRHSVDLVLDAVPEHIDPGKVRDYLGGLPGVVEIHDLHIWAMSTTETALTVHLVMPNESCHPRFLCDAANQLHDDFGIQHATIQVEAPEAPHPCRLAPEDAV